MGEPSDDMSRLPEPMTSIGYQRTYGGNKAFHNYANDYTHITDPNLRRRLALSDIDKVPFGLHHVRAVAVAGAGFFLDSYSIFGINLVTTFLGLVFWQGPPDKAVNGFGGNNGTLPSSANLALKVSTSAGIVIGQVVFGWAADAIGRRKMYGIELGIIMLATFNCALASPSQSMSSTGVLTFWRVIMGIGVGGDYPLSSVITSEFAPTRWRGAMMAAVFTMQGVGQLLCAIVALVVTVAFKSSFINIPNVGSCDYACQIAADRSWRIIVGFGAVPACVAMYWRITIPETPRYTFDVAQDVEKADADIKAYLARQAPGMVDLDQQAKSLRSISPSLNIPKASWPDIWSYFSQRKHWTVLVGTTLSWFFLDLAFYGLGLNSTVVLETVGYSAGETLYHTLYNNAVGMIILACAGSLPGYCAAIFTIDTFGRKTLQVFGFGILTIIFCVLGFAHASLSKAAMLTLYVLAQFFFNWGPNTTTFIIPGECFPTRYRSMGHGISAASGKIGAIVAQLISVPLLSRSGGNWLDKLLQIFALFMLCGTAVSFLVPETKGYTLEELGGEQPTSYNAGRNMSVTAPNGSCRARWALRRLSPRHVGRPAGFWYPRASAAGSGARRADIMTSPEMATRRSGGSAEGRARKRRSAGSRMGLLRPRTRERGTEGSVDGDVFAATDPRVDDGGQERYLIYLPAVPPNVLPGWGAGWGRIIAGAS